MADNVDVTPGSGATIATDDVSGVQYQRVKIDVGGDGAASPLVRGQQSTANSLPVTLPSDQGELAVTGTFWQATQPVSGTVAATQSGSWSVTISDGSGPVTVDGTVTADTELPAAASITATGNSIPSTVILVGATGVYNGTTLDLVQSGAGDGATSAQKLPTTQFVFNGSTYDRMRGDTTNGLDVDVTRVGGTVTTKETRAATSSVTSVAASASSGTVLASNANRLAATVFNDSTALLYLKLGATASSTSHTVQIQPNGYYEVPGLYTGIIDGIWASATGNARVTELTA